MVKSKISSGLISISTLSKKFSKPKFLRAQEESHAMTLIGHTFCSQGFGNKQAWNQNRKKNEKVKSNVKEV